MPGLFAGTPLERPVTCEVCERPLAECGCPRDANGIVTRPRDQVAIVRREKRRRGKIVTTVGGLDATASDLPALLKQLKTGCGAGGTISDGIVEVQGDHRERVSEVLRAAGYRVRTAG